MPCCVLRVDGAEFDPDAFLAMSALVADVVYHRGGRRSATSTHESGGFTVVVSEADGTEFKQQVTDAIEFLRANRDELARLGQTPGVQGGVLDFGCDFPHQRIAGRYYRLPLALLGECTTLCVEIELSVYAVGEGR